MSSSDDDGVGAGGAPRAKRTRVTRSVLTDSEPAGVAAVTCAPNGETDYAYANVVARRWERPPPNFVPVHWDTTQKNVKPDATSTTCPSDSTDPRAAPLEASLRGGATVRPAADLDPLNGSVEDPTPPPTPDKQRPLRAARLTRRRLKRGIKQAMTKLQKMQHVVHSDEDDDCCVEIIDTPLNSPASTTESARAVTVKIRCPKSGLLRLQLKQTDSLSGVLSEVARREGVGEGSVVLYLNDRTLRDYDSPRSLSLTAADIIECHIRRSAESGESPVGECASSDALMDASLHIPLCVQCDDRIRTTLVIRKDEPVRKLLHEFCRLHALDARCFVLQSDGDPVDLSATPSDLDLEPNFCVDVVRCAAATIVL